jgi:hypothetical protein
MQFPFSATTLPLVLTATALPTSDSYPNELDRRRSGNLGLGSVCRFNECLLNLRCLNLNGGHRCGRGLAVGSPCANTKITLYAVFPFQVLLRCGVELILGKNFVANMLGMNRITSREVVEREGMGTWVVFSLNIRRELADSTARRLWIETVTGQLGRRVVGGTLRE